MLYFEKDSIIEKTGYGDLILAQTYMNQIRPPSNPYEFDYKSYLAKKGIYHQSYIPKDAWQETDINRGNWLFSFSFSLREKVLTAFKKNGIHGREYAVASALVLGYKGKLDKELQEDFAGAGAMHVLCVSGLHVGIIYVIINSLLIFFNRIPKGRIFKTIIILIVIWFYAILTGMSPSVLRASTMFSFVAIAVSIKRNTNIYNTIAASAFILLVINPLLITEVGFQLSYAAVIGIIILQPKIYQLWKPRNIILDKIWALTGVSIAAQLATFPMAIYYFQQFPNYFILTNLLVIPLASIVLYGGLLVAIFSIIPQISLFLAGIFSKILMAMHSSVSLIENLPHSTSTGLQLNETEVILLYLIIIFFVHFLILKKLKQLKIALLLSILLLTSFNIGKWKTQHQKKLIVYNTKNFSAIDFVSGTTNYFFSDTALSAREDIFEYSIRNNWWRSGVNNHNTYLLKDSSKISKMEHSFYKANMIYRFYDKTIAIIHSKNDHWIFNQNIETDILIICDNARPDLMHAITRLSPKIVIIDATINRWEAEKMQTVCAETKVQCHYTYTDGAFEFHI